MVSSLRTDGTGVARPVGLASLTCLEAGRAVVCFEVGRAVVEREERVSVSGLVVVGVGASTLTISGAVMGVVEPVIGVLDVRAAFGFALDQSNRPDFLGAGSTFAVGFAREESGLVELNAGTVGPVVLSGSSTFSLLGIRGLGFTA